MLYSNNNYYFFSLLSDKKYFNLPEIVYLRQIQKKCDNAHLASALDKKVSTAAMLFKN
jgi:hypothetical protein